MIEIEVYHSQDHLLGALPLLLNRDTDVINELINSYKKVCVVKTTEIALESMLEEAFRLTNSIDYPWVENDGIVLAETDESRYRSTSVGDLMFLSGKCYMVDSFGFKQLEDICAPAPTGQPTDHDYHSLFQHPGCDTAGDDNEPAARLLTKKIDITQYCTK